MMAEIHQAEAKASYFKNTPCVIRQHMIHLELQMPAAPEVHHQLGHLCRQQ